MRFQVAAGRQAGTQLRHCHAVHAGLERLPLRHGWPAAGIPDLAQLRQGYTHAAINRLLRWRLSKCAGHVVIVQGSEEAVYVLARINPDRIEIPVKIQACRIDFATPQLQQRGDESASSRQIKSRRLRRSRCNSMQRQLRLGQFLHPEIRRHQAIDFCFVQAFEQLRNVPPVRPGSTKITMGIEIHHHPADIHPLMLARSEQRRERRLQGFQHRLDCLTDDIIRCSGHLTVWRGYRHDRRSFRQRSAADQKDHKKYTAYDE
ncbi:hypothetical protein D3C87_1295800 [compost metagenome]